MPTVICKSGKKDLLDSISDFNMDIEHLQIL